MTNEELIKILKRRDFDFVFNAILEQQMKRLANPTVTSDMTYHKEDRELVERYGWDIGDFVLAVFKATVHTAGTEQDIITFLRREKDYAKCDQDRC